MYIKEVLVGSPIGITTALNQCKFFSLSSKVLVFFADSKSSHITRSGLYAPCLAPLSCLPIDAACTLILLEVTNPSLLSTRLAILSVLKSTPKSSCNFLLNFNWSATYSTNFCDIVCVSEIIIM